MSSAKSNRTKTRKSKTRLCCLEKVGVLQTVNVHPHIERQLRDGAPQGEREVLAVPVVRYHEMEAADIREMLQGCHDAGSDERLPMLVVEEGGNCRESDHERKEVPKNNMVGVKEEYKLLY